MNVKPDTSPILADIKKTFGITLLAYNSDVPGLRPDVTQHGFYDSPTDDEKTAIRRFVEERGWQYSRQVVPHPAQELAAAGRKIEHIFIGPRRLIRVQTAYHATRLLSVPSIRQNGLLPSTSERQTTTDRCDCEGNIYLCRQLGTLADAGVKGAKTAHWWRHELAQKSRFAGEEWVILQVAIGSVSGARCSEDVWSESGIIADGVPAIPWDGTISQVFP